MLLGAWWVLPAALQQWSSKLLNLLLLFIPEQSGTKRWPCIIFCFPSDPDADAGAGVAGGYTQMWHHPRTCCAAGDGCAASRAASSLSLQVLGETFSWQVRRALLLSAPSYLGAYLCCKHFTWANKNSTLIAALSHKEWQPWCKELLHRAGAQIASPRSRVLPSFSWLWYWSIFPRLKSDSNLTLFPKAVHEDGRTAELASGADASITDDVFKWLN